MTNYEIVAFYKENESEVSGHAAAISKLYSLKLRYERVPELPQAIYALLTSETVLCMLSRETFPFKLLMKYVYALKKPTIIVHPNDKAEAYNNLKLPIGYVQENKEKVVWANFFHRNNPDSNIELLIPREKDENIVRMVNNNLHFIENIFQNSGARYTKTRIESGFEKSLIKIFQETDCSVIFIMLPFRVFSWQIPYNIRLFRKYAHTPTLLIPRDDKLYVPCH